MVGLCNFDGRVALITGSGSGMGRAYAQVLSENGCDIVINDIDEQGARETAALVEANGRRALVAIADVADSAAVQAMVERALGEMEHIDILFNNAGIGQQGGPFEGLTDEQWDRMFRVHVSGSFYCARAVVPQMKRREYGKIVNISSTWGMVGWAEALSYCSAKSAILGFTKSLAKELAPWNINVNAIAPGGVLTPMPIRAQGMDRVREKFKQVPLKRWAEPIEIGYLGAFLVSDEASFITGQVVSSNGGEIIVGC
jgi:3-oxoacyl-[acyl-carrier protein] reductase